MERHLPRGADTRPTAILSGRFALLTRAGPHQLPLSSTGVGRCPKPDAALALLVKRPRWAGAALSTPSHASGHPLSASLAARVAWSARGAGRVISTTSTTQPAGQDHIGRAASQLGSMGHVGVASSVELRPVSAISRLLLSRCTAPRGTVHYITTTCGVKGCANLRSPSWPALGDRPRHTPRNGRPLGWSGPSRPLLRWRAEVGGRPGLSGRPAGGPRSPPPPGLPAS